MSCNNKKSLILLLCQWFIFLFVILPPIIPLILALFLYRNFILFLHYLIHPSSLSLTLSPLDHAFSTDSFSRPRGGTSFIWICEGKLNPSLILDRFTSLLEKEEVHNPHYSRLVSLYPESWMGIPFWKKSTKEFRMKNHFQIITPKNKVMTQDQLNEILVVWMRTGFVRNQPLWEVMVMPSVILDNASRSVLGLKIHHSIGDGYSKLRLLERIIDNPCKVIGEDQQKAHLNYRKLPNLFDFLHLPSTTWKLFNDFILHSDIWTQKKSGDDVTLLRATYPMSTFKELRSQFGSLSHSPPPPLLLLAVTLLAGALRRYLGSLSSSSMSKSTTNFVVALPTQGAEHPSEFCNFWSHALLNVQLGEESPTKRLTSLIENYNTSVKANCWPEGYSRLVLPLQALLPTWAWNMVTDIRMGASIGCTNMVGPSQAVTICRNRVLEKYAYVGLLWRHSSMTCGFFSYNDTLSLTLVANKDVTQFSPHFEDILTNFLQNEMDLLKKELLLDF